MQSLIAMTKYINSPKVRKEELYDYLKNNHFFTPKDKSEMKGLIDVAGDREAMTEYMVNKFSAKLKVINRIMTALFKEMNNH